MNSDTLKLETIMYDPKSRDGTWCCFPYENHPHGCPNFIKSCTCRSPFTELISEYEEWYAVVEKFNLKSHASAMKIKHPLWTERQCRNPLYWQGGVRSKLKKKATRLQEYFETCNKERGILLDIPEANGINVFETMAKVGIIIDMKPDVVKKVMILGTNKKVK